MTLIHLCKMICNRHLRYDVMKEWQTTLQEEFEPLRPYFRPMDRLAQMYPGKNEYQRYRIVIHRDGSIVGIDDEDDMDRISLTRSDIVLYEFDLDLFRRSLCDVLGIHYSGIPLTEFVRAVPVGTWEAEKSARFPVHLLLPGAFNLRDKVFERIVEKTDFGEILLMPPRRQWDDIIVRTAQRNNILLVPLDEVIHLENGKIQATPEWGEYLTAFCKMVDVALPSRYRKVVHDYIFARRDGTWFCQFGETTSTLDPDLLGPSFIQYLLKYPNRPIPVRELWGEVMGRGRRRKKAESDFVETASALFDGDAMLDREAKENYRNRLRELARCRAVAEANNDCGELDRINTELEMIQSVLKSAHGLGGRTVKIGSDVLKLRDRIRHAIGVVIKRLGKNNPNVADYLKKSITSGVAFQYSSSEGGRWKWE